MKVSEEDTSTSEAPTSTSEAPTPEFTIAELLRDAVERLPSEKDRVFTARELAEVWGYRAKKTCYIRMDKLEKKGWKFIPTRKAIIDRAGRHTTTDAYLVVPPEGTTEDATENATKDATKQDVNADSSNAHNVDSDD